MTIDIADVNVKVSTWTEIAPMPVKKFRGFRYLGGIPAAAGNEMKQDGD